MAGNLESRLRRLEQVTKPRKTVFLWCDPVTKDAPPDRAARIEAASDGGRNDVILISWQAVAA